MCCSSTEGCSRTWAEGDIARASTKRARAFSGLPRAGGSRKRTARDICWHLGQQPRARRRRRCAAACVVRRGRARHHGQCRPVRYRHDRGAVYLESIDYAIYRVDIHYEERPDVFVDRFAGFRQETRLRCTRIEVHRTDVEPSRLREYRIEYVQSRFSNHSLLASVALTGFTYDDGVQQQTAPALRFEYTAFEPENRELRTFESQADLPPADAWHSRNRGCGSRGQRLARCHSRRPQPHTAIGRTVGGGWAGIAACALVSAWHVAGSRRRAIRGHEW